MNLKFLLLTINFDIFQSRDINAIINELTHFIIDQIILSNKIIIFLMNLHVTIITLFNFFEFVINKIKMKSILIM